MKEEKVAMNSAFTFIGQACTAFAAAFVGARFAEGAGSSTAKTVADAAQGAVAKVGDWVESGGKRAGEAAMTAREKVRRAPKEEPAPQRQPDGGITISLADQQALQRIAGAVSQIQKRPQAMNAEVEEAPKRRRSRRTQKA